MPNWHGGNWENGALARYLFQNIRFRRDTKLDETLRAKCHPKNVKIEPTGAQRTISDILGGFGGRLIFDEILARQRSTENQEKRHFGSANGSQKGGGPVMGEGGFEI